MSWLLGLGSILLPATLMAGYLREFRKAATASADPDICGMPLLAAVLFCLALALALSLPALALALLDYRRLDRPRPRTRLMEALAVGGVSIALPVVMLVAWLLD